MRLRSALMGAAVILAAGANSAEIAPEAIRFNRHIRPILSDKCFACHGPDAGSRKAGLRLDVPLESGGDASGAIVPGDPDASELITRIMSADPDEQMPPPSQKKQLSEADKALIRAWIAEGAEWEPHWAYIPPRDDAVTRPADFEGYANPIDAFIDRRLAREGVTPAGRADKVTLVRRLHWDLIGIPPTPEVVAGFLASDDPGAYAALVDSLLASPHYGERMAMDWLDAVRYADTNGYHSDEFRSVYPYRDYVIAAFNENMPFDQFTREQLAGDLLPNPTRAQLVASGYNRMNQITAEGGAQPKEYIAKYAADRVRATGTVWLGQTMGCAECHDHKFDPIPMKDFYSFAAFFADVEETPVYRSGDIWAPRMYLPTPKQEAAERSLQAAIVSLEGASKRFTPELETARAAWRADLEAQRSGEASPWRYPAAERATAKHAETTLAVLEDGRIVAAGPEPDRDVFTVRFPAGEAPVSAIVLESVLDAGIGGVSRGGGNFVLTEFEARYHAPDAEARTLAIAGALGDFEQDKFPVSHALDGKRHTGWATGAHVEARNSAAIFRLAEPLQPAPGSAIEIVLSYESGYAAHQLDSFRIGFSGDDGAARLSWQAVPRALKDALAPKPVATSPAPDAQASEALVAEAPAVEAPVADTPPAARADEVAAAEGDAAQPNPGADAVIPEPEPIRPTPEEEEALSAHFLAQTPLLDGTRAELSARRSELDALRGEMATTLITVALEEPRVTRVLPRGNWLDESGSVVEPETLSALPPLGVEGRRATRLDLANWLVDPENPLTARVTMNRLWKRFYGAGISGVLDDFGAQGEWPTHPDLLDWLALEFVRSGWDMKHMVRLMVTSEAYQRDSQGGRELIARDPFNRLYARQSRYRVEAELVRDGALAVSGLLARALGGRSVYPYQPEGYYANCNTFGGDLSYPIEQDENQYRRGLYTFWKRSFLHPSLLAFDAPTREECTAERTESNTPQQALVLLNDPTYVEAARAFAQRIMAQGGERSDDRIAAAFQLALSRAPRDGELEALRNLYHAHLMEYTEDPSAAEAVVRSGIAPVPEHLNPVDLAAWTSVARVILNLHETITRS